jgi:hypothetical protein
MSDPLEVAGLRTEIAELNQKVRVLKHVLGQIVNDLPSNRDWLDPHLERYAKELLNEPPKS